MATKKAPAAPQLALFDQDAIEQAAFAEQLLPGEIVVYLDNAFQQYVPFWQVRAAGMVTRETTVWRGRQQSQQSVRTLVYHLAAVPYGETARKVWSVSHADAPRLVQRTGLTWRVPGWDEIARWDLAARKSGVHDREAAQYCRCVGYGRPDCGWARYGDTAGWHHCFGVPYPAEAELVARLAPLGDRTHWTHRNVTRKLRALELRILRLKEETP